MLRVLLLLLVVAAAPHAQTAAPAATPSSDLAQIERVLGLYMAGHATGVLDHFREAFHPDALMFSSGDGEVRRTELRTWWETADGQPKPDGTPADDEAERHRRVVSIDVSGPVATAKLELDYPGVLLHDYMTLVKASGRWQIVNKSFAVHPKGD